MNPSTASYNSSAYQPIISTLQREKKTYNFGGRTGFSYILLLSWWFFCLFCFLLCYFSFFLWVRINRNKRNNSYPPTVADCFNLLYLLILLQDPKQSVKYNQPTGPAVGWATDTVLLWLYPASSLWTFKNFMLFLPG